MSSWSGTTRNSTARQRRAIELERERVRVELERRRRARERTESQPPVWSPLPGPQTDALNSKAQVVGFGGAAGGGKSSLIVGASLTQHKKSIIFRREYVELREIIDQARELLSKADDPGRFNANDMMWRFADGRTLELGAVKDADDWQKFRGRPHDLLAIDEATEFLEMQVRGLMGWVRTVLPDQRCRVILTFNPPTSHEGEWVLRFFAPWLDPEYPDPAMPGELRWFAMIDGKEVECVSGEPFEHESPAGEVETIRPMSRTFIPARLADNPYLSNTGYGSVLQSLPEPLRSQLLHGDFAAGVEADPWQVIPTAWVQAAQRRWFERLPDKRSGEIAPGPMVACGMDVAHGGKDKTVFAPLYLGRDGGWIGELTSLEGKQTPDGKSAAAECVGIIDKNVFVNVDAIGYGASAAERLRDAPPEGFGVDAVAVNVAAGSTFTDRSKKFRMRNVRAEMYWRLREELDPDGDRPLALPPDKELLADLCAPRFEITTSGIKIEAKDEIKERLGRSPDKGDAVALAMLPRGRGGFAVSGGSGPDPSHYAHANPGTFAGNAGSGQGNADRKDATAGASPPALGSRSGGRSGGLSGGNGHGNGSGFGGLVGGGRFP